MNIFEKFKSTMRKNSKLLLLLSVILTLVLAGYYIYLYLYNTNNDNSSTYVTALGNDLEKNNDWDNVSVTEDYEDYSGEYMAYSAELHTLNEVYSFLDGIGFDSDSYNESDGIYHWQLGDDSNAFYIANKGLFSLSTDQLVYENTYGSFKYNDNLTQYVVGFLSEYLNIDQEIDIEVEKFGDSYFAYGRFIFDGIESVDAQGEEFQISMNFNKEGQILNLVVPLVSFSRSEEVNIIDFEEVIPYLSNPNYPKESVVSVTTEDCIEDEALDCYADNASITNFDSVDISDVKLVYQIDISETKNVVPVYLLTGEGYFIDELSKTYPLEVSLLVNAINPVQVVAK